MLRETSPCSQVWERGSPHQTGRENALLYGSILGHGEEEMLSKLDEIIEFSELGSLLMSR